jgi:glycosyltransferase involved in cell wall biosynthesis
MRRLKVWHVITGLQTGGAEVMLYRLLGKRDPGLDVEVVSLTDVGPIGEKIRALGVPVRALGLHKRAPNPLLIARLARWMRRERPDVVQTWMHDADLLGGLAALAAVRLPMAWGIHQGEFDLAAAGQRRIQTVARVCGGLSKILPRRIVCCSETSRRVHAGLGYDEGRMVVIPNGFDLERFRPDPEARGALRNELGLGDDAPIIGAIGRDHPQKDHATFLRAAALLAERRGDVHFVLCGEGLTRENTCLSAEIGPGLAGRVHRLGRRDDIPRVAAGLDLFASSSAFGEAFPLVIGEAMAAGVPCAVTDVGDSARMVGETGRVVARRDPAALARAWEELLALAPEERARLGRAARARIEEQFALEAIVGRYEALYRELAGAPAKSSSAA